MLGWLSEINGKAMFSAGLYFAKRRWVPEVPDLRGRFAGLDKKIKVGMVSGNASKERRDSDVRKIPQKRRR